MSLFLSTLMAFTESTEFNVTNNYYVQSSEGGLEGSTKNLPSRNLISLSTLTAAIPKVQSLPLFGQGSNLLSVVQHR